LGYMISHDSISPDPEKVDILERWPKPRTTSKLQQFAGFVNYYRKFINGYAEIAIPLYDSIKENNVDNGKNSRTQHVRWTKEREEAFDTLITKLRKQKSLSQPKQDDSLIIETGASSRAIGSILSRKINDSQITEPLAFFSRVPKRHETHYPTQKKELLAIVETLKRQRHWFHSHKTILIRTDNKSLENLKSFATTNSGRLAQWRLLLGTYNLPIEKRSGENNARADTLSRLLTTDKKLEPVEQKKSIGYNDNGKKDND
jgi:RNase H-like domain found in reverse transcriptase